MSRDRRLYSLFVPLFFASGFAALVCQTVWQRLLTFFGGADVHSATIVVTAFMAGLGAGGLVGGPLADRLSPAGRLLAFAAAELAVGCFTLLSAPLMYGTLYLGLGERALSPLASAAVVFATLLWPTFFMGVSLPLLSRIVSDRVETAADRIGGLYGWNTLGAALGSVLSVWWLVRWSGFEGAIAVAAALQLLTAAAAVAISRLPLAGPGRPAAEGTTAAGEAPPSPALRRPGFAVWLLLYGLAGFVALSLEIVWFRMLGIVIKSSSFTFATLLAVYLLGIGAGALVGRRFTRAAAAPGQVFLALQAAVGAFAALSTAAFVAAVGPAGPLDGLRDYLGAYDGLEIGDGLAALAQVVSRPGSAGPEAVSLATRLLVLYAGLPLYFVAVPTLLMGASFAFLQRAVQDELALVGRRVGWLQAANIAGSTLGAAATGLLLLRLLGTAGTLRLLVAGSAVFLVVLARRARPARRAPSAIALAAGAGLVLAVPDGATLWAHLHGARPEHASFAEDGSGLALLKEQIEDGVRVVTVHSGGLGQSALPYGGYHAIIGVLPALLHPAPARVAVIGLGSGETAFAIGARDATRRIDCVEIVAPQLDALRRLARRRSYPGLELLLTDGRVRFHLEDGRAFLMRSRERYDLIETDALRPSSSHSGNLYSVEYFRLLRDRLAPGGLAVIWGATPRVRETFLAVFPHVLELAPTLIGSEAKVPFDLEAVRDRLREPFTADRFRRAGLDAERLLEDTLARAPRVFAPDHPRSRTDLNTDLFPRDEYLVASTHSE